MKLNVVNRKYFGPAVASPSLRNPLGALASCPGASWVTVTSSDGWRTAANCRCRLPATVRPAAVFTLLGQPVRQRASAMAKAARGAVLPRSPARRLRLRIRDRAQPLQQCALWTEHSL